MSYKSLIEKELLNIDFEVVTIDVYDMWYDEKWTVQFKFNPGIYFYLVFFRDQGFEEIKKKGWVIDEIKAVTEFPKAWNDDSNLIASLEMRKGIFSKKLAEFISKIEAYKIMKIQAIVSIKEKI